MQEEQLRFAFSRVKEDISILNNEVLNLRAELSETKELLKSIYDELNTQKLHKIAQNSSNLPVENTTTHNATIRHINSTEYDTSTHNATVPQEVEGLKSPNLASSTGNEGVSTDTSTDRQTDTSTDNSTHKTHKNTIESNIQEATEILESLDNLKKQIRLKFKRVTPQEMSVFSTIYQLEEQDPSNATYKEIAIRLNLTQSSIRDYVQRMINKGIPIKKQKINNKKLILSISQELKSIATLSTIIQLRDL